MFEAWKFDTEWSHCSSIIMFLWKLLMQSEESWIFSKQILLLTQVASNLQLIHPCYICVTPKLAHPHAKHTLKHVLSTYDWFYWYLSHLQNLISQIPEKNHSAFIKDTSYQKWAIYKYLLHVSIFQSSFNIFYCDVYCDTLSHIKLS